MFSMLCRPDDVTATSLGSTADSLLTNINVREAALPSTIVPLSMLYVGTFHRHMPWHFGRLAFKRVTSLSCNMAQVAEAV